MSSLEAPLWWDRDIDRAGRPIRLDVREAALSVWQNASTRIQFVGCDPCRVADLIEKTIAQLSRYLNRHEIALFSRNIEGLVAYSLQRALRREAMKCNRLLPLNESVARSKCPSDEAWQRGILARVELQELMALLNDKSRSVLALRYAGYTWKESAQLLGESLACLRSAFWRDVNRVKRQFARQRSNEPAKQKLFQIAEEHESR